MSIKDFKTRNEIIINVGAKRRPGDDAAAKKKRRGSLPTTKPNDGILHRRQSKLIRFFDCGQIPNGSGGWKDLNFVVDPGYTIVDLSPGGNYRPQFQFNDFTLAHWNQLVDRLFETPLNNWADHYRKVEYADGPKYGISEYQGRGSLTLDIVTPNPANLLYPGVNPEWTPKGLKPLQPHIEVYSFGGLGLGFNSADTTSFKITKTRDYSAPAAGDFSVQRGADIFLVPHVHWTICGQVVGIDTAFRKSLLFGNWTTKSRELWLDKTARRWFNPPFPEVPVFEGYYLNSQYHSTGPWMFDIDDTGDAFTTQINNWVKARGLTTLYVQRGTFASGGATFGFEPLSSFPFHTSVGAQAQSIVNEGWFWGTASDAGSFDAIEGERYESAGILCAVIKTPAATFYAWRNLHIFDNINLGGSTSAEIFY